MGFGDLYTDTTLSILLNYVEDIARNTKDSERVMGFVNGINQDIVTGIERKLTETKRIKGNLLKNGIDTLVYLYFAHPDSERDKAITDLSEIVQKYESEALKNVLEEIESSKSYDWQHHSGGIPYLKLVIHSLNHNGFYSLTKNFKGKELKNFIGNVRGIAFWEREENLDSRLNKMYEFLSKHDKREIYILVQNISTELYSNRKNYGDNVQKTLGQESVHDLIDKLKNEKREISEEVIRDLIYIVKVTNEDPTIVNQIAVKAQVHRKKELKNYFEEIKKLVESRYNKEVIGSKFPQGFEYIGNDRFLNELRNALK